MSTLTETSQDSLGWVYPTTSTAAATDFLELTDTPDSYVGQAGKLVAVNSGGTALIFIDPTDAGIVFSDATRITSSGITRVTTGDGRRVT